MAPGSIPASVSKKRGPNWGLLIKITLNKLFIINQLLNQCDSRRQNSENQNSRGSMEEYFYNKPDEANNSIGPITDFFL